MERTRYVLLGLGQARSAWFREVSQWVHSGAIGAEFLKCLSAEEVRARLAGGRAFSALLVDGGLAMIDRDLIHTVSDAGCAVIVVGGPATGRDWLELGATAKLPPSFDRHDLVDALSAHARVIPWRDSAASDPGEPVESVERRGHLVAVTGPGGTGASTSAIALAQGLAATRPPGSVLLADFRLNGELAMLHDAGDVIPSVQELVDSFRVGRPSPRDLRALTFAVPQRGYQVLLGLRRSDTWATVRPRAFEAALNALRDLHRVVIADVEAELEGEEAGGSVDIEERNVMARTVSAHADAVFVVGVAGMKGLYAMIRVIRAQLEFGVPEIRLAPVINRAPRSLRTRAELTSAFAQLLPAWAGASLSSPIFLPERRVDDALHDGVALPGVLCDPLVGALRGLLARADDGVRRPHRPNRVAPGTVGFWMPEFASDR